MCLQRARFNGSMAAGWGVDSLCEPHGCRSGSLECCNQQVADGCGDLFVCFVDREVALNQDDAVGLAAGDLVILFPYAAVKGVLLGFKAGFVGAVLVGGAVVAAAGAVKGGFKGGQQQEGQVGLEVAADEAVESEHRIRAELAAAALVGFGGVGEAVAEDDFAGVEGGLNDFGDGLGAVGEHKSHFGHGIEGGGAGIEDQGADAVAGFSAAGLACQDWLFFIF